MGVEAASGRNPPDRARVVAPADLTLVKVNVGRGFARVVNWDDDVPPVVGQGVTATDGGSERLEAVTVEACANGTLVLAFPAYSSAEWG